MLCRASSLAPKYEDIGAGDDVDATPLCIQPPPSDNGPSVPPLYPSSPLPPPRIPPGRPEGWWAVRMRQVDIDILAGEEDESRLELLQDFIESKVKCIEMPASRSRFKTSSRCTESPPPSHPHVQVIVPLLPSEHAKIGSLKGAEGNVRHVAMEDAALACRSVQEGGGDFLGEVRFVCVNRFVSHTLCSMHPIHASCWPYAAFRGTLLGSLLHHTRSLLRKSRWDQEVWIFIDGKSSRVVRRVASGMRKSYPTSDIWLLSLDLK